MNIVSVAILKEKLSHYLGLVKQGEEVVVTSHRHKVARIVPVVTPASRTREPSRPVAELLKLKGAKPRGPMSAVETLISDRQRR
jgi:prevent-host-death family protein